jgi:hypothetical protein
MSFTYDESLSNDLDWVRMLLPDKVTPGHALEDEEITAVLAQSPSNGQSGNLSSAVYYAAATLLESLHRKYMTGGKGKASRKVSRLTVVYGTGSGINIDIAVQNAISKLRAEGARLLATYTAPTVPGSYILRVL